VLGPPNGVGPHIIWRPDIGQTRGPCFRGAKPHGPQVPDAVIEAVPDGNRLGEHALLDHPGHRTPGRAHPSFLALGSAGIDVPRRSHDVYFPVGAGVKLGPVVIVYHLPGAYCVCRGHHIRQTTGLGIPLPAKLVAHDSGDTRHAPRPASRVDVVIIPCRVPKVPLEVALSQGQPGIVGSGQCGVSLLSGHGLGRLAGRQIKASAIGGFAGQPQVVIGLVDTV